MFSHALPFFSCLVVSSGSQSAHFSHDVSKIGAALLSPKIAAADSRVFKAVCLFNLFFFS